YNSIKYSILHFGGSSIMTISIALISICVCVVAAAFFVRKKSGRFFSLFAVLVLTGCSIFGSHAAQIAVESTQKPPTPTATETTIPTSTPEPTATIYVTPTLDFLGYFTDTYDNNIYGWYIDRYISLSNGYIELDPPNNSPWDTSCDYCLVTPENNYFEVDMTWRSYEQYYAAGILLDYQGCTTTELAFILFQDSQDYEVAQAVYDENGDFQNWRYYFDWIYPIQSVSAGSFDTNTLGAEYEFLPGSLYITLYANGNYVNRFQVYDYNGSEVCNVGMTADDTTQFDNFRVGQRE
ncbi:MAG TPA: hypothetical protein VN376_07070, partial [Longilinea sp.]|nr:hypothetical protein [Longilinea sp.]